jgi:hypothetical protein
MEQNRDAILFIQYSNRRTLTILTNVHQVLSRSLHKVQNTKNNLHLIYLPAFKNIDLSHASAVAQGCVVRVMSASYGKSQYSTLRRNQTLQPTTTKIGLIDYVGDLNRYFHSNRLDKGAPTHT